MAIKQGDIVRFLRDIPEFNIILANTQFDDEDLSAAMRFSIAEYNELTPVTTFTETNFPFDRLLLLGAATHLMNSEAFLQLRNQLNYQDGDVAVGVDDKWQLYMNLRAAMKAEWKEIAQKVKQQQNMEQCYGSLSSGYRFLRSGWRR